jgi:hypothetical protein
MQWFASSPKSPGSRLPLTLLSGLLSEPWALRVPTGRSVLLLGIKDTQAVHLRIIYRRDMLANLAYRCCGQVPWRHLARLSTWMEVAFASFCIEGCPFGLETGPSVCYNLAYEEFYVR